MAGLVQEARYSMFGDACELVFSFSWRELTRQLSSGYTVGEDGNRYVFTMNKKRYPDFKGMVSHFHKAGIKVIPNIKPCKLNVASLASFINR
jgi:alpha-glucosidase (family GH31 glycosyl hydrolase)